MIRALGGEADIDTVYVTNEVGREQERHQAPGDAAHGGFEGRDGDGHFRSFPLIQLSEA